MQTADRSSRRTFIKRAVQTMAVGIGLGVAPGLANQALGAPRRTGLGRPGPRTPLTVNYQCCANATQCGGGCSSGKVKFWCTHPVCQDFCTACRSASPNCYSMPAGGC